MKVYKILFKENSEGVYKVSYVKDPAVETTLLKFSSEEEVKMYFANEEKRIIYAPAMIPDKMIFRSNINGEAANVFYDSETIEKFQQNYFRNNGNAVTNINHKDEDAQGIFPFESWIIQNKDIDKSKELGFDLPNGTWMMGFKIDSDEIWQQTKEGNLDGLSVEMKCLHELQEETNNQLINMNKNSRLESVFSTLREIFAANPIEEEKKDEEVKDEAMAEAPVEGSPKEEEAETTEQEAIEPDAIAAEVETLKSEIEDLKSQMAGLKKMLTDAEAANVEANTKLEQMAKQTPASKPIVNMPVEIAKSYEQMTNFEKLKFNKNK